MFEKIVIASIVLVCSVQNTLQLADDLVLSSKCGQFGLITGSNVKKEDVEFVLYNARNNYTGTVITFTTEFNNVFVPNVKTIFIVHGWVETRQKPYYQSFTDEYKKRGNFNIIHVDWSVAAFGPYTKCVGNTYEVGNIMANFTITLLQSKAIDSPSNIHLLGHSLGAHVTGVCGKQVYKLYKAKIGRITGLDPARPCFEVPAIEDDRRLHRDDAVYVDVVHTDAGGFGYVAAIGMLDFYPNGGTRTQPNCFEKDCSPTTVLSSLQDALKCGFCSHTRSYEYYIMSINTKIDATRCNLVVSKCVKDANHVNERTPFGEDANFADASGSISTFYVEINKTKKAKKKIY